MQGWIPEEILKCIVFFILKQWRFFFLGLFRNFRKAGIAAGPSFLSRHCWLKTAISLWILLGTELHQRECKSRTKEQKSRMREQKSRTRGQGSGHWNS